MCIRDRHTTDLALRRDLSPNFNTAPNLTEVCSKNKLVVESRAIDLRSCLSRAVSCCGHGIRSQSSRTEKKLHIISEQVDLLTPVLLLGWGAASEGNAQLRNYLPSMSKKDKMTNGTPRRDLPPQGRVSREGDGSFQVVWRTSLDVDLERTQNYCVELLALYLRPMII